ncbi:MAG: nucleotidyl transferase AbiEii/AbiGii toxin family protein [Coriobacteriia bacterium]|nr:nucleotidyl transferase AbiEii/AbiGii toxin family protein [Coriobacteriia bacterium]MCL2749679.1 nucleotidyl transferase AbiEii/AbiGii toxin family protein [Coriobacteriia bacterium]
MLGFVRQYNKSYYLVGGTAIALQIGHRKSIDFDLFTHEPINRLVLKKAVSNFDPDSRLLFEDTDQIHFIINGVKLTFFSYPYEIEHPIKFNDVATMPTLLTLAAMKAFALGRRAKWKDYVDLYFLLRDKFTLETICTEADRLFGKSFSERLFRGQLAYHQDIDYGEAVDFTPGYSVEPESIRAFLVEKSLEDVI